MKFTYNKLVRDRIPEIIKRNGKICEMKNIHGVEYLKALHAKLHEEVDEYLETGDVEQLADLEEVIYAVLDFQGVAREEFEKIRVKKAEERGIFKDGVFVISVSDE